MATKNIAEKLIYNWFEIEIPKTKVFVITEDIVSVEKDSTKWVSPYNTSYWYTNITIDANCWIEWIEWALYIFVISTKLVVASAYRNVRIRIWTTWDWKPLMWSSSWIMAWNSYFTKWRTDIYIYKSTYQVNWALYLNNDTSYSAMSVAEWKTGTATSSRVMRADYLKQIIEYHISQNHQDISWKLDKIEWTSSLDRAYVVKTDWTQSNYNVSQWASSNAIVRRSWTQIVVPETPTDNTHATSKKYVDDAVASAGAWNMSSLVQFWRTWWRWTKAMFNALEEKDVNGVYIILSEKDYQKMIND